MKLQRLIIRNFRWLKWDDNIIDFSNSNIIFLVWQNNVWKSSFLRAYEFFYEPVKKATEQDFYNYNQQINIEIEGVFLKEVVDDSDLDLSWEPDWISKWCQGGVVRVKKIRSEAGRGFDKFTFDPTKGEFVKNGFGWLHTKLSKYIPKPLCINAMETAKTLEEKVVELIKDRYLTMVENNPKFLELQSELKTLRSDITSWEDIEAYNIKVNKYFQNVFLDLKLAIIPKKEEIVDLKKALQTTYTLGITRENTDRNEFFDQQWHWVIRQALFNFLAFLQTTTPATFKEYIILFEEPELFLHPDVAFKLRKSLYEVAESDSYQILCCSHSPLMIDISKPHSSIVRIIKDGDETTHSIQVGDNVFSENGEMKSFVQMINRFNPHICEVFYSNKIILVEWDTEAVVFRYLLSNFFPDSEILVLNCGTKNNMPFFQKILNHFKIQYFVIHDTDTIQKISSRTLNETISWLLQNDSKRYVFKNTFEVDHNYSVNTTYGKPLSAYNYIKDKLISDDIPCINILKDILDCQAMNHTQSYIASLFT